MRVSVVVLFTIINCVLSKVIFDIDGEQRPCPGIINDLYDISELEIIAINDTLNVLNGTFKVLSEMRSPFEYRITTQRLTRGQWVSGEINRVVSDFCVAMQNRLDAVYTISKHFKNRCPFKPGVSF